MRLATLIREERLTRFDTHAEFARAVHLSIKTISNLERGQQTGYSPRTKQHIEDGLGWPHGTIDRIVEGGRAVPPHDAELLRVQSAWPRLDRQLRRAIVGMVEDALRG